MTKHHCMTKMVVRNLAPGMTADELNLMFAAYGVVHSISLVTDVMTGRCGGFGFVSLDEWETGNACAALDGSRYRGRVISVKLEQKAGRADWRQG